MNVTSTRSLSSSVCVLELFQLDVCVVCVENSWGLCIKGSQDESALRLKSHLFSLESGCRKSPSVPPGISPWQLPQQLFYQASSFSAVFVLTVDSVLMSALSPLPPRRVAADPCLDLRRRCERRRRPLRGRTSAHAVQPQLCLWSCGVMMCEAGQRGRRKVEALHIGPASSVLYSLDAFLWIWRFLIRHLNFMK